MKQFVSSAFMAAIATAARQECLYCRRQDKSAGFLVSYSYCNQSDTCLKDAWNYITRKCESGGWRRGRDYEIDFCDPDSSNCPTFKSSQEYYQVYVNQSWSLAEGGKCNVAIDATEGVARVIFDNTNQLGIDYDDVNIGDVITIESGIANIEIYNGAEKGPLTFDISFSGASYMSLGAATVAAALTYLSF